MKMQRSISAMSKKLPPPPPPKIKEGMTYSIITMRLLPNKFTSDIKNQRTNKSWQCCVVCETTVPAVFTQEEPGGWASWVWGKSAPTSSYQSWEGMWFPDFISEKVVQKQGCSVTRVSSKVCCQGGLSSDGLSSGWSFIRWSVIRVDFHQMVCHQGGSSLFGLSSDGLSSWWSFIR